MSFNYLIDPKWPQKKQNKNVLLFYLKDRMLLHLVVLQYASLSLGRCNVVAFRSALRRTYLVDANLSLNKGLICSDGGIALFLVWLACN